MTQTEKEQMEKEVMLEEYKYLTSEILNNQSSQRKMIGFGLTAAAPIVTIISVYKIEKMISEHLTMIAFLLAIAFVYSTMAIIYLGLLRSTLRISEYFNKVLFPDINNLIEENGKLLKWELYLSTEVKGKVSELIGFCFHTGGELLSLLAPSFFSVVLLIIFGLKWEYYNHWIFVVCVGLIICQYVLIGYYSWKTAHQSIALKKLKSDLVKKN